MILARSLKVIAALVLLAGIDLLKCLTLGSPVSFYLSVVKLQSQHFHWLLSPGDLYRNWQVAPIMLSYFVYYSRLVLMTKLHELSRLFPLPISCIARVIVPQHDIVVSLTAYPLRYC